MGARLMQMQTIGWLTKRSSDILAVIGLKELIRHLSPA
jgi:hypothetical protein